MNKVIITRLDSDSFSIIEEMKKSKIIEFYHHNADIHSNKSECVMSSMAFIKIDNSRLINCRPEEKDFGPPYYETFYLSIRNGWNVVNQPFKNHLDLNGNLIFEFENYPKKEKMMLFAKIKQPRIEVITSKGYSTNGTLFETDDLLLFESDDISILIGCDVMPLCLCIKKIPLRNK